MFAISDKVNEEGELVATTERYRQREREKKTVQEYRNNE
jgi:hypothetical protein